MADIWNHKTGMPSEGGALMEITRAELPQYDGKEGRRAYVAVNGLVYDVTDFPPWAGGIHNGLLAGADLTMYFKICHKPEQLAKVNLVGRLVD